MDNAWCYSDIFGREISLKTDQYSQLIVPIDGLIHIAQSTIVFADENIS
jgi:hypothetical protein